jgi:hypothetical protein
MGAFDPGVSGNHVECWKCKVVVGLIEDLSMFANFIDSPYLPSPALQASLQTWQATGCCNACGPLLEVNSHARQSRFAKGQHRLPALLRCNPARWD